jgi:hypothetical protein
MIKALRTVLPFVLTALLAAPSLAAENQSGRKVQQYLRLGANTAQARSHCLDRFREQRDRTALRAPCQGN